MSIIRITSKRQATLPKALCDEMGVQPGDSLSVQRVCLGDKAAWILRPSPPPSQSSWLGSLKRYATGKPHDMQSIRQSIEEAKGRVAE